MKGIQCIEAGKAVVILLTSTQNKEQQHMLSKNIKKFTVLLRTKYAGMEEAQKHAYTHYPKKFHSITINFSLILPLKELRGIGRIRNDQRISKNRISRKI